jgi:aryl-phospho-beta-D-glucosidase BglC (GH1 family)
MRRLICCLAVACVLPLAIVSSAALAAKETAAEQTLDPFELWRKGALRGANVMPPSDTVANLTVLRSWGANLAEIAVMDMYDPRPPYSLRPAALEELDRAVSAAEQAGLFVALTCRTGPGRADFETSDEIWTDPEAQRAYARMWAHLAGHYQGRKVIVGYDLMCEPHPPDEHVATWNALAKQITAAIRKVDLHTPILVNATGWAYPEMFDQLEPTGDKRTVYVVHFYAPHYYTHQRPGDNRAYPGFVDPHRPGLAWDKRTIKETLEPVRRFQLKHRVPIFAGEFGCARYAPGAVDWLRDQMDLYEEYGWSWAYWDLRGWHVMDIEMTADAEDRTRYPDTPLLRLFKSYFARCKNFPAAP